MFARRPAEDFRRSNVYLYQARAAGSEGRNRMSSSGTWALRSRTVLAAIALALGSTVVVAQVRTYEMHAKPLSQALRDYGRIADVQIIFPEEPVRGRSAERRVGK